MAATAPLDTTIEVVTPENIAFRYQLAGPFRRLPAFLIDFVLKLAIIVVASIAVMLIAGLTGSMTLGALGFAAINIGWFLVWWFYGVALETWCNGRTFGKMAMGIRVVTTSGHPIGGGHAMLRNLISVADLAPAISLQFFSDDLPPVYLIPTGVVAIVTMICSRRMQRLGDLAAGTMVVIDERGWTLPVAKVDDARVPALASFVPPDYRVSPSMAKSLALYAERRTYLSPQRRREVARHLAGPLIVQFEFRPDIDPDLMLYALYWRTFLADQRDQDIDLGPLAAVSPLARDATAPVEMVGNQVPITAEVVEGMPSIDEHTSSTAVTTPPPIIATEDRT